MHKAGYPESGVDNDRKMKQCNTSQDQSGGIQQLFCSAEVKAGQCMGIMANSP